MDVQRTPRIRVSAALGLSAQTVLDATPNAVVAVDDRGRIVYANPRVQETFGWSPEDLRGNLIESLVPPRWADQHAAQRGDGGLRP